MTTKFSAVDKIGEQKYKERFGFGYHEFTVGDTFEHFPARTITESDAVWMSMISGNNHPIHIDEEYSKNGHWGKRIVSSLVTVSIVGGMSLGSTSAQGIANLGWKNIELPHPVFIGDTLRAESKVLAKRESNSRPNQGIITIETTAYNQEDKMVLKWERSFLIGC